jgi:hypothetical protein
MIKAARVGAVCLALVACSHKPARSDEPQLVATVVTESTFTEINEAVTPAMLVGRWGESGDCAKDIVINADGAFRSYALGAGAWTLNGNMLNMVGSDGASLVWVGTIGADQLVFGRQDRSATVWRRCP